MEYLLGTDRSLGLADILQSSDVDLHSPALCDIEVTAALRRGLLVGRIADDRAAHALDDYLELPLTRHGHQSLLRRMLRLRRNFSAYDATYVALAEQLGGELLTADDALASAVRSHLALSVLTG